MDLTGEFGAEVKTKFRVPMMTGALGSTFIAARYWDGFAIGAALVGYPIVVGENVGGIDKQAVLKDGKISKAPELDRRIDTYLRYYDGYGAIIVQLNVEDTRNGVAEYVIGKYGDKVIIELKWGQGAKDIGGEIQVNSLEYALFLKERGYVVDPDPRVPEVQEAFKHGAIKSFAGTAGWATPPWIRRARSRRPLWTRWPICVKSVTNALPSRPGRMAWRPWPWPSNTPPRPSWTC